MSGRPVLVRLPDERARVAGAAARWKKQYHGHAGWIVAAIMGGSSEEIHRRLVALPVDATAQDVAAIIGNDTWCSGHFCDGCNETVSDAWQIGQEPDYESHTAVLCDACMARLVAEYQATR